ncbi:MAG: transglycosylase SLT domain-containing protein [Pseudomonadota bacterium]
MPVLRWFRIVGRAVAGVFPLLAVLPLLLVPILFFFSSRLARASDGDGSAARSAHDESKATGEPAAADSVRSEPRPPDGDDDSLPDDEKDDEKDDENNVEEGNVEEEEDREGVVPGEHDQLPGEKGGGQKRPAELDPDEQIRRSIRGTPSPKASQDPHRRLLEQFEKEAFGNSERLPGAEDAGDEAQNAARSIPTIVDGKGFPRPELRSFEHRRTSGGPATSQVEQKIPVNAPWLRSLKSGDLSVRWDRRVIRYLEFYRDDPRGRAIMSAWIRGMGTYRRLILDTLKRHGLPADLVFVCMIESSFNPREYSRAGASGLWQFMPSTARIYGLRIDYWVDERNDPVKSTEAAALFLKDLYERFRNWHLALAAYNAGHGAVINSIAKYNTNEFWTLLDYESGLPWESSIYVPKALAASIVGRNLAYFGFDGVEQNAPFQYDETTVSHSISIQTVAKAIGVSPSVVADLNPSLRRGRTPPQPDSFNLRIPEGTKTRFIESLPQLRDEWEAIQLYVLRHGERFEDVARTYGISERSLRELNGVNDILELRGGMVIVVPRIDEETRRRNQVAAEDDLYSGGLPSTNGAPLLVPVPDKDLQVPGRRRAFYRVVAGDSLESVASVFAIAPGELARWNGLDPDARIQPRMILTVYVDDAFDQAKANVALLDEARLLVVTAGSEEHLSILEQRKGRSRIAVVAKKGDTLESIGRRYGLSKYNVARINRRSYNQPLKPGEKLFVYRVVDQAKAKAAGVSAAKKRLGRQPGKHGKPSKASKASKPSKASKASKAGKAGKASKPNKTNKTSGRLGKQPTTLSPTKGA